MSMSDNKGPLFEIRCPLEQVGKDNKLYKCNRICVEVHAGSSGRARCRSCHRRFEFELDDQAKLSTGVRVQKEEAQLQD